MKILGIDPGYAIVGYSILNFDCGKFVLEECGVIETSKEIGLSCRLLHIFDEISCIIKKFAPSCVSIETLYFQNNQKTAINVAQARGVILLAVEKAGVDVFEYTPLQVKSSLTGFGRATKNQMMLVTQKILNLKKPAKPDDAADAIALAVCHASVCRFQSKIRNSVSKRVI